MDESASERRLTNVGPAPGETGWLALVDDELLFRIQSLAPEHGQDDDLVAVVRSDRHFFVRQEAAKRIRDPDRLKAFASDRHVGQILARRMMREGDIEYLEELVRDSRHLEVRKAAKAQLEKLKRQLGLK